MLAPHHIAAFAEYRATALQAELGRDRLAALATCCRTAGASLRTRLAGLRAALKRPVASAPCAPCCA